MISPAADPSQPLADVAVVRKLRSKLPQRKRWCWQLSPPCPSLSLSSTVSSGCSKKLRTTDSRSKTGAAAVEGSDDTLISASSFSWCASSSTGGAAGKRQEERNSEHVKVGGENGAHSESIVRSEVTSIQQHSPTKSGEFSSKLTEKIPEDVVDLKDDDVVSVASTVGFCSFHETDAASSELQEVTTKLNENRSSEFESSLRAASTVDPKSLKCDADLTCTEELTYDDVPEYSSGYDESFSDLQFPDSCDYDFSSSPYLSYDSGSQFSERSSEDSPPSHTFALLLQFREQFSRSSHSGNETSAVLDVDEAMNFGLDDEEDALSYQMFRNRERTQVLLWNHDEQCSDYIIGQRSHMVHWMIDHSRVNKLQKETLFLAVGIFDRFLRAGSFKSLRNFQIAGVACLTLANRIEENQPYNSVRQMVFHVGSNTYRRCEVVAMEWLVLEAICFQCCSVTLHNFLWFYLKAAGADNQLRKMVKDLAEVALLDHEVRCFWPSTVAAALVIMACPEDDAAQRVIETHVRSRDDDLTKCIEVQLLNYAFIYSRTFAFLMEVETEWQK